MSYREPNYKDIIISKVITGIWGIYLFSFFIFWMNKYYYSGGWTDYVKSVGIVESLLVFGIFIFQFFLVWRLLKPKKTKKRYTNFTISFHPVFKNSDEKIMLLVITLFGFIFIIIYNYFDFISLAWKGLFDIMAHIIILSVIIITNKVINYFPIKFMKSNSLRIIVKYQDYINHKIALDEPHLTINQNFDVSLKLLPRNDSEKNLIEIKNPNTPINPALVYKIEDKDLADALRNGFILRAKLIEIKEEGNLEIELSLKENGIESY
jgi:hypothetical protein